MSLNIFDIPDWAINTQYAVNDIVLYGETYFYARSNHNSGTSFNPNSWAGTTMNNGETKPCFIWKPTYNSDVIEEPRIKSIKFGDGYEQTYPDGINNDLLVVNLTFDLKSTQETVAIVHFLHARQGTESFVFTPPPPFGKIKRFKCYQWNTTYNFKDNHTTKAKFEEVVV